MNPKIFLENNHVSIANVPDKNGGIGRIFP